MKSFFRLYVLTTIISVSLPATATEKGPRPGSTPLLPLAASINLPGQEKQRDLVARRIDANDIHSKTLQLTGLPQTGQPSDVILILDAAGNVINSGTPIGLLGGGTSGNVPNTLVLRDGSGNFAANVITANLFLGNVSGNIIGNVSGAASENVLRAGDTMTGELRISDPTHPALILNNNTTTPTAVFTGNGTTQAPALQLINNPTATDSNFFLTIDSSGNITESNVTIGSLMGGTSSNIPNTLVLRDNQGSFAAQVISAQGLDVVGTSTFHNYIYTPFATVQPQNILYVHKGVLTAPNQFNSIKDAVDSITTGTGPTTPFVVKVGAGTFIEDTITMKSYVGIVGTAEKATFIQASAPNQDIIHAVDNSFLEHLTLSGATDPGMAAINFDGGSLRLFDIDFDSNDILLKERATTQASNIKFTLTHLLDTAVTSTAFDIVSTTTNLCTLLIEHFIWTPFTQPMMPQTLIFNLSGPSVVFHGDNLAVHTAIPPTPGSGTIFLRAFNGADVHVLTAHIMGFDTVFSVPSAPQGPEIVLLGILPENSNTDVFVADQRTSGYISGQLSRDKLNINPATTGLSVLVAEPTDGGVTMVGPVYTGRDISVSTNLSPAFNDGTNLGLISQGLIFTTTSSLVVTVSAGTGYLMQTTAGVDNLKELEWQTTTTILLPNADNFIYINNAGQAQVSPSDPPELYTLFMGKVRTSSVGALFVEAIHDEADHTGTKLNDTFTEAFGPIYIRGSVASHTGLNLAVTGGEYVYGTHFFAPVGADPLTWQAYLGAGANEFLTTQTAVDYQHFDNGGALADIPVGYYAKHLLYVIGGVDALSGTTNEAYALVYSQTVFATLNEATVGPVPIKPVSWTGNIVPIASIIVTNTFNASQALVEILDERPRPGFVPSSVAGVTVHGNLLGLLADDHPQYLLTNGGRVMTGSLQMGANNITNVGTVNGVTVQAHAARHLPNSGADPLTVAAPVTIGTINSAGTADSFVRSDHVHAHGAQTDPTLHALATTIAAGFMSAADKQALTNATSVNTPSTIVMRDANGDFAAGTVTAGLIGNVTGNVSGNLVGNVLGDLTGNVVGNVSGAASANVLKVGDTMSGQLRISDATQSALVLNNNTATPTAVVTGNSTTLAPALRLVNNPTMSIPTSSLTFDTTGYVLTSDLTGNIMQSLGNNGDTFRTFFSKPNWYQWTEPRLELSFFDDFTNSTATGTVLNSDTNWTVAVAGGGAAIATPPALTANRDYGVVQPTLSASGSFVVISKNPTLLSFGQGTMFAEARVSYAILGIAAQQYVSRVGFGNSVNATDFTNGIYFEYANGTSGDVWRCRTINGGVATTTVTTTPVVAATYNNLRIEVNSDGTSVNFFIDGTLVATHTTNIPTAVANASTPTIMITKTNGGTARTMNCDYFMYHYVFSSNRSN